MRRTDEEYARIGRAIELHRAGEAVKAEGLQLPAWWPADDSLALKNKKRIASALARGSSLETIRELIDASAEMEDAISPPRRCPTMEEVHAAYAEGLPCPPGVTLPMLSEFFPFIPGEDCTDTEARRNRVACDLVRRFADA